MSRTIHSLAPARISLAGGGTDVSPYTEQFGGAVTNFAISMYMEASLRLRDDEQVILHSLSGSGERAVYPSVDRLDRDDHHRLAKAVIRRMVGSNQGLELTYSSPIPERSGLGGSSALCAAMVGCFNHLARDHRVDAYELAELVYTLERHDLQNLGGRQDQYASIFGGLNYIEFKGQDFVRVNPIRLPDAVLQQLQRELLLFWIGDREASGGIIEEQVENLRTKSDALQAMHDARRLANQVKVALVRGELGTLGDLLHVAWLQKKRFGSRISNPHIDALYNALRAVGMRGGKITGAGGGGHLIAFVPFEKRQDAIAVVEAAGGRLVQYRLDLEGLKTWEVEDG